MSSITSRNLFLVPESPLDDALISNHDSNEFDQPYEENTPLPTKIVQTPQAGIAHSTSFTDFLSMEPSSYSTLFPLTFRYVLLIENYLFLYIPAERETSVMILREKIKALKLISSSPSHDDENQHQQQHQHHPFSSNSPTPSLSKDILSDYETVSNVSYNTNNSLIDDEGFQKDLKKSFVTLKNSSKKSLKHSDSINTKKKKKTATLSRRKSGYHTLNSESSNTLSTASAPDGKEEYFFAMSNIEGRQSITDIQPLLYQPADYTVSEALRSLPLPRDEALSQIDDNLVKENMTDKSKFKADHSIALSLRVLGLQNLLFLLNSLLMEEVWTFSISHHFHSRSWLWDPLVMNKIFVIFAQHSCDF